MHFAFNELKKYSWAFTSRGFNPSAGPHCCSAYCVLFLQQSGRGLDDVGLTGCGVGFIPLHRERKTALKVKVSVISRS